MGEDEIEEIDGAINRLNELAGEVGGLRYAEDYTPLLNRTDREDGYIIQTLNGDEIWYMFGIAIWFMNHVV